MNTGINETKTETPWRGVVDGQEVLIDLTSAGVGSKRKVTWRYDGQPAAKRVRTEVVVGQPVVQAIPMGGLYDAQCLVQQNSSKLAGRGAQSGEVVMREVLVNAELAYRHLSAVENECTLEVDSGLMGEILSQAVLSAYQLKQYDKAMLYGGMYLIWPRDGVQFRDSFEECWAESFSKFLAQEGVMVKKNLLDAYYKTPGMEGAVQKARAMIFGEEK